MVENENHYMVGIDDVQPMRVSEDDGWSGMDIRFPFPEDVARIAGLALFRAVFGRGAAHKVHRHPNAHEFFYVVRGRAEIGTEEEVHEVAAGTVEFVRRGKSHWLRNLEPDEEVEVVGGYLGVATLDEAGYEYVGEIPAGRPGARS